MKIGIMSMQRVINYGSYLQAYGLKKKTEELFEDCSVEFVDYLPEPSLVDENVSSASKKSILSKAFHMMSPKYRAYRNDQIKMNTTFGEFAAAFKNDFLNELGISQEKNYCPELDTLIIGSDEVFNCTQPGELVGYSKQLFGKNNRARKLISYAASFGSTTLQKIRQYNIEEELGQMLKDFDSISVRDQNSVSLIEKLSGVVPEKNIDPVLFYDFPEADEIKIDLKDYIVVYAYADRIKENEAEKIKKFAESKGKKILSLGFWQTFADEYILARPLEVLAYIKNADYVVTDTFHGTVFSIKYQVPFATIIRESNKEKLSDLLETFGLESRRVFDIAKLDNILENKIPEGVSQRIKEEQKKAEDYLLKNI